MCVCVSCAPGRAGWEDCPAFGQPLFAIIPSKVPLGVGFKEVVPAGKRFSPDMAVRQLHLQHHDVRPVWAGGGRELRDQGIRDTEDSGTVVKKRCTGKEKPRASPSHCWITQPHAIPLSSACSKILHLAMCRKLRFCTFAFWKFSPAWHGGNFLPFPVGLFELRVMQIGLVIDLTKTTRYYNPREFIQHDIKYIKVCLQCTVPCMVRTVAAPGQGLAEALQLYRIELYRSRRASGPSLQKHPSWLPC